MACYSQHIWAHGPCCIPMHLESWMVPQEKKTYVMYHGTTAANAKSIQRNGFRRSEDGMFGPGIYVSRDLRKAGRYPLDIHMSEMVVLKLLVNVGRVKRIDYQGHPLQKTWHQHGYDTAWCPPNNQMTKSGLEEDCIWDPKRIKVIGVIHPIFSVYEWSFSIQF